MPELRPPAWLKVVNAVNMGVQKLGIPTGPVMVLTVPGRKSGEPRRTPVTPFDLNGGQYVIAGFPNADWAKNARASGTGTLTRGRKARQVALVELPADQAVPVLRAFPTNVPVGVGFYKRNGLVVDGTPDEFESLAGRCPVFRLEPA